MRMSSSSVALHNSMDSFLFVARTPNYCRGKEFIIIGRWQRGAVRVVKESENFDNYDAIVVHSVRISHKHVDSRRGVSASKQNRQRFIDVTVIFFLQQRKFLEKFKNPVYSRIHNYAGTVCLQGFRSRSTSHWLSRLGLKIMQRVNIANESIFEIDISLCPLGNLGLNIKFQLRALSFACKSMQINRKI